MILHTNSLKIYLISILPMILFVCCTGARISPVWYIIGNISTNEQISLDVVNPKGKIHSMNIPINSHKLFRLEENERIMGVEHNSSYNVLINLKSQILELYLFPQSNFTEDDEYYYVDEYPEVEFYFIEGYDSIAKRNFYIISKDNKIEKKVKFEKQIKELDVFLEKLVYDCAFYNNDEQPLSTPYNGYIIKNQQSDYVILSSLWAQYSYKL